MSAEGELWRNIRILFKAVNKLQVIRQLVAEHTDCGAIKCREIVSPCEVHDLRCVDAGDMGDQRAIQPVALAVLRKWSVLTVYTAIT